MNHTKLEIDEAYRKNAKFRFLGIEWTLDTRYAQIENGYAQIESEHGAKIQLEFGRGDGEHISFNENDDEIPLDLNKNPPRSNIHLAYEISDDNLIERDLKGYLNFQENAHYMILKSTIEMKMALIILRRMLNI